MTVSMAKTALLTVDMANVLACFFCDLFLALFFFYIYFLAIGVCVCECAPVPICLKQEH